MPPLYLVVALEETTQTFRTYEHVIGILRCSLHVVIIYSYIFEEMISARLMMYSGIS